MDNKSMPQESQRQMIADRKAAKVPTRKVGVFMAMLSLFGFTDISRDERAQTPIQQIAVGGILVGISFVIALTMLSPIQTSVDDAKNATTDTAVEAILDLLPLLFVVGLAAGGVTFLVQGFRGLARS